MKTTTLLFQSPRTIHVHEDTINTVPNGHVLVTTDYSAISAGTELHFYRGTIPPGTPLDTHLPALATTFHYPCQYGYALVGHITLTGPHAPDYLRGQRVFLFHPHTSHALVPFNQPLIIPDDIIQKQAVFFPSMQTALTLIMDSQPLIGEHVLVYGQGTIGLLTTALLSLFPIHVTTIEPSPLRRRLSKLMGADTTFATTAEAHEYFASKNTTPDLILELSGNPQALTDAVDTAGFQTRIIVGSWYDTATGLRFTESFHRKRLSIISSQVSTLHPRLTGRWDHARRIDTTWDLLKKFNLEPLISHEFTIAQAADAYRLLDTHPESTTQILLTYPRDI